MQDPNVSLEKRIIQHSADGVWKKTPAIDRTWAVERAFPSYMPPPITPDGTIAPGAKQSWNELLKTTYADLIWLLNLPHHRFWSQIIFDKSALICVTSFLQEAPPIYCQTKLPADVQKPVTKLSRVVFLVLKRLTTSHESDSDFISPEVLGDILYENYILTVPSLLDICVVYGGSNRAAAAQLIQDVVRIQPTYLKDFLHAVPHLIHVLENATGKLGTTARLSQESMDMIVQVFDSLVTTRLFLEIYPQGCEIFANTQLVLAIASFYTSVMPNLSKTPEAGEPVGNLRIECLKLTRTLMENVLNTALEAQSAEKVEHYLNLISEIMSEGLFICDFNSLHPIQDDFEIIQSICPDMDQMKLDYLIEALASHVTIKLKKIEKPAPVNHIKNYSEVTSTRVGASSSVAVNGVQLLSLISQVKDLLPHLGDGYIEECLKYYDYSAERTIEAVLESTLPPNLEELNWQMERSSEPVPEPKEQEEQDEKWTVFRGKKPREHRNMNQMLSDKREINAMKDKFVGLGLVDDEYDDEYDDTYDSVDVSVKEPDAASAATSRRPFVVPRVLQPPVVAEEEEEESEEEAPPNRDHFVQNPETLRARAEERRAQRGGHRDVVGRAKGQGQEKDVLNNRSKKNVNKSSVGNHHRRDRASKKRNQGMIPS